MIKSIYIDNFKALNNARIPFTPFTMLIGNNSVGKTTVLQAIAFLKYCCTSYLKIFMSERNLAVTDICSKFSNKRNLVFETELTFGEKTIIWSIEITAEKFRNQFSLSNEKVKIGDTVVLAYGYGKAFRLNAVTGERDSIMEAEYDGSIIRFVDVEKDAQKYPELVAIKKFFLDTEALDLLSPTAMKGTSQGESEMIGLSGEKLGSFIKRLSATERDLLTQDIQKFIAPFSAVVPKTKRYGWVHLEAKENYGGKTIDVSSSNISDGILRIIALCSLRFLNNPNGAILLDEIEDGINNEHLELLVQVLQQIQAEKNVQIIATTHNTVLLDYWIDKKDVALEETQDEKSLPASIIFLFRNKAGGVIAKNIFSSSVVRDKLSYMFPGEIVLNMTNSQLQKALSEGDEP